MTEVIRVYSQAMPEIKLVGRCYSEADKVNGTFSNKWDEWFRNNLFAALKLPGDSAEPFEDCDAYIGLCRCKQGEPFQYWIGVFMPLDAVVPQGYDSIVFDASDIAVCWIYGKEPDVYTYCCLSSLEHEGFEWASDNDGAKWCFERYVNPRFTSPDEKGNIILDMCFFI